MGPVTCDACPEVEWMQMPHFLPHVTSDGLFLCTRFHYSLLRLLKLDLLE